jgi:transcriptional regulator
VHSKGASKAEVAGDKQRTEENVAAVNAAAERRVEATKGAVDVQQTVNNLPDDDVSRELRESWRKPTSCD